MKQKGRVRQRTRWTPWIRLPEDWNRDPLVDELGGVTVVNNVYHVEVAPKTFTNPHGEEGELTYLSIKRHDKRPIHDWRELLRIKNDLVGPECWAVEAYPPMSHLMDTSNQFHLYVFPEGYVMPFGIYAGQQIVEGDGTTASGESRQRPLPDWYPAAMTPDDADDLIATLRKRPACEYCGAPKANDV